MSTRLYQNLAYILSELTEIGGYMERISVISMRASEKVEDITAITAFETLESYFTAAFHALLDIMYDNIKGLEVLTERLRERAREDIVEVYSVLVKVHEYLHELQKLLELAKKTISEIKEMSKEEKALKYARLIERYIKLLERQLKPLKDHEGHKLERIKELLERTGTEWLPRTKPEK